MDDAAARALARLREGDALDTLARMVVDQTTATPIREIATPRWIASQLATVLEAASGDAARGWAERRVTGEQGRWSDDSRLVRELIAPEVEAPLRELLGRQWSPDEDLAFRVLDQAAVRDVLRMVLTNGITRFRRRLSEVDSNVLGGLGKRAAERGRGLLGGLTETVGRGRVGGLAQDLVGTLKEEVEGSLDTRVADFARSVATDQVRMVARHLADPNNAEAFATFRLALLDVLLDTTAADLAEEIDRIGPVEAMQVVVAAVRAAVADPSFVDRVESRVARVLDETGDGTLGAWLTEIELLDVWRDTTTELVAGRLRAVVHTQAFAAWWDDLHR